MGACAHFEAGRCRSCAWLPLPVAEQLARKQQACAQALADWPDMEWRVPVGSAPFSFRNKAKMVVSGTAQAPVLGLMGADGQGVDLTDCPLYPSRLQALFEPVVALIRQAGLVPYDIARRQGELKYVLLTQDASSGQAMLRLVLRSTQLVTAVQAALSDFLVQAPAVQVVSVNIQPVHQAIVEGEEEHLLTAADRLVMWVNQVPLELAPRSFFQTNTQVAAALYATARDWVAQLAPAGMWDLFCGVGGFALQCAPGVQGPVTGIEVSAQAIASACASAEAMGLSDRVSFRALSADDFALGQTQVPELVLVNPPRRGIGEALCAFLEQSSARWLVYSSCNPHSLAQDMRRMPSFRPVQAQLFDMFPHTHHAEVLVLLQRR